MVQVPTCSIAVGDQNTVLTVEKLPSVADVVKVSEAVNSSLRRGKLANYAVTEPTETPDGLYYIFELHDVNRDLTFILGYFRPCTVRPVCIQAYEWRRLVICEPKSCYSVRVDWQS